MVIIWQTRYVGLQRKQFVKFDQGLFRLVFTFFTVSIITAGDDRVKKDFVEGSRKRKVLKVNEQS